MASAGCASNTDGIDGVDRFESTFEKVYTAESLRTIPWYAIAGKSALHPPPMVRYSRWTSQASPPSEASPRPHVPLSPQTPAQNERGIDSAILESPPEVHRE